MQTEICNTAHINIFFFEHVTLHSLTAAKISANCQRIFRKLLAMFSMSLHSIIIAKCHDNTLIAIKLRCHCFFTIDCTSIMSLVKMREALRSQVCFSTPSSCLFLDTDGMFSKICALVFGAQNSDSYCIFAGQILRPSTPQWREDTNCSFESNESK